MSRIDIPTIESATGATADIRTQVMESHIRILPGGSSSGRGR
jgi:hypothetical protein